MRLRSPQEELLESRFNDAIGRIRRLEPRNRELEFVRDPTRAPPEPTVLRVEEARAAEARSRGEDRVAPLQAEADLMATSAASVRDKLARYSLNLEHPVGGSKAVWFQQALGFTRENSDQLARQLVFNERTAVRTEITEFGTKYNQSIKVLGANGRVALVTTGWIRGQDGIPRLVTAIPGR